VVYILHRYRVGSADNQTKDLTDMMLGTPNRLSSQFRLTYNMILNLLRVEALKVEEMIKRSFSEAASQKAAPEQQRLVEQVRSRLRVVLAANEQTEKQLAKLPQVECQTCTKDISPFYDLSAEVVRINTQFITKASWETGLGKTLAPGRVVVLHNGVSWNLRVE